MEGIVEGVRWVNALIGMIGLVWLVLRSHLRRREYPYSVQLFLLTLGFFVGSTAYGSIEAATQNADVGMRTWLYLVANSALLVTLMLSQKRRDLFVGPGICEERD